VIVFSSLADAVAALKRGEVVGIPTDTVYGIVTLPAFGERLYEVKGRPRDLELPILIADASDVSLSARAAQLGARFWPGRLTIVDAGVGYRVPDHDVPRELARRVGPLASTSANKHGEPPLTTAAEVAQLDGVAAVIDGGVCDGAPSTVVRVNDDGSLGVIREGAVPVAEVRRAQPPS
jgi:tRNA threonylcarbamoyl adenosine modification protein (Sua5/YciO/YrdC/YwlC family)